jgi:hypothetical protein
MELMGGWRCLEQTDRQTDAAIQGTCGRLVGRPSATPAGDAGAARICLSGPPCSSAAVSSDSIPAGDSSRSVSTSAAALAWERTRAGGLIDHLGFFGRLAKP